MPVNPEILGWHTRQIAAGFRQKIIAEIYAAFLCI
jgi:hypothetical protein